MASESNSRISHRNGLVLFMPLHFIRTITSAVCPKYIFINPYMIMLFFLVINQDQAFGTT